ncbi:hypothetical protein BATDEDRAFT_88789 [Batrachochytrium dendrobatidis JAM81]|uniref:Cystathionine beta-lyase n=1 Tax=Batrachochytrium dendrobatidis (strain JAM81 / FGSC 10211) TaxID=684364 RepID=F4P3E6_BATDJ|nr:cystathionine beta-lyase STR3 [Batrachochytrium dendrobatidis JAM81]EGF80432.1 hypothetical protein BATDEDRAFT_88789 [Batrachochytrium dendrobatidis JAM81]KAJ8326484.1 cystathionine beta-lyase [Batrachochytrium dendrobatidis]KAK5666728.1 cystathionine beta-lyase [Batrachochytrium dendrobatidis]|eukprot:XP_006679283.1 hypothetical protein BATDEDRAFT_88789 [Batrachochytrium dendrobatidis JAM81]
MIFAQEQPFQGQCTYSSATTHNLISPLGDASTYRPSTQCVLVDSDLRDPYRASSVPIYQTATFRQSGVTEMGEYDYSRSGNPTRTHLESHLAKLMHAHSALAVSSGMSALDIIIRLVKSGEEIIAGDDVYGGTNRLLAYVKQTNNIKVYHTDTTNIDAIQRLITPLTKLVLLETPTNPMCKIADIPSISNLVHTICPSALVVVDNTMMSPYLQKPLDLGADIVYHSATKFLSGHHDLMAGAVGVKNPELAEKLYFVVNAIGCGLAPFDAFLLARGIKTLSVRVDRQQQSAMLIASYLESHGIETWYPGLKSHPQHDLHMSMAKGGGAVLSFRTNCVDRSISVVNATKIWGISVSFGSVNSLISMPCRMSHASIPAEIRKERNLPEDVIRLCVGIEDVQDLISDLHYALVLAGCIKI